MLNIRLAFFVLLVFSVFSGETLACLTVPAPSKTITSLYGWRFHPVYGRWRLHRGVDFRAQMGTPLVASENGTVQVAFSGSGGNELRIVGDDGTVTRYLHLTRALVEPGSHVAVGQEIAISGNTGEASAAPHLHFEVYPKGVSGGVNPEPLLCPSVSRKPGADKVDGFPIMACDPNSGKCSAGTNTLPPAASAGGGVVNTSGGPVTGSSQAPATGPDIAQFDDMSTNEILSTEVMKRFGNPDWYKQIAERTAVPLMVDYVHMLALDGYIELQKKMSKERVEALLATKLARDNKKEIDARLARQREVAAATGK